MYYDFLLNGLERPLSKLFTNFSVNSRISSFGIELTNALIQRLTVLSTL